MITEELYLEFKRITNEEACIVNGDTEIETEMTGKTYGSTRERHFSKAVSACRYCRT